MKRSKSKTPSAEKRPFTGPRVDWVPPHPALGAQVTRNKTISLEKLLLSYHSY
jgi:hypothetical protein